MRVEELDLEKIKVKRWSFCESCKGQRCPKCNDTGIEAEKVLLSEIPKALRQSYVDVNEKFIRGQLKKI